MFYLIAAAMAALSAGDAPAQRVVKVAADYLSADFGQYGDADGDGLCDLCGTAHRGWTGGHHGGGHHGGHHGCR